MMGQAFSHEYVLRHPSAARPCPGTTLCCFCCCCIAIRYSWSRNRRASSDGRARTASECCLRSQSRVAALILFNPNASVSMSSSSAAAATDYCEAEQADNPMGLSMRMRTKAGRGMMGTDTFSGIRRQDPHLYSPSVNFSPPNGTYSAVPKSHVSRDDILCFGR